MLPNFKSCHTGKNKSKYIYLDFLNDTVHSTISL